MFLFLFWSRVKLNSLQIFRTKIQWRKHENTKLINVRRPPYFPQLDVSSSITVSRLNLTGESSRTGKWKGQKKAARFPFQHQIYTGYQATNDV